MAREENLEDRFLEEMPACLRELFEQTSREQEERIANNVPRSPRSQKTTLALDGMRLPPPLLTKEERAEMRQYRREAVKCEARMFDRRREKYSSLIFQVMSVMDRIQERERRGSITEDYVMDVAERTLTEKTSRNNQQSNEVSNNLQFNLHDQDSERRHAWDAPHNGRNSKLEHSTESFINTCMEHKHDQPSRVDSQNEYLHRFAEPHSSVYQRGASGWASTEDNANQQLSRNMDFRGQSRNSPMELEGIDLPLSSIMGKDVYDLSSTFSQHSLASGRMSHASDSLPSHKPLSSLHDRNGLELDSLASTSLSMALSESSISTVQSVVEMERRSAAQRQLHMDSAADEYRDYQEQYTGTSGSMKMPQENHETNSRPESRKQNTRQSSKQKLNPSSRSSSQDQVKTLAHLDKLKQKLLEEKEKQIQFLKQQELTRLRSQNRERAVDLDRSRDESSHNARSKYVGERPHSVSSFRQSDLDRILDQDSGISSVPDRSSFHQERSMTSLPQHRPYSMPPGEMYSILEVSGEDFDRCIGEYTMEPESSSDKENHVGNVLVRGNRTDAQTIKEQGLSKNVLERRDVGRSIDSTYRKKEQRSYQLGLGDKFSLDQGRSKFAKVSAYAKGFLTRLLFKTEKVQALIQTIKDTRDFLADISKEDSQSFQERMLKENVESHLKVARWGLYDVFFTIPAKERMSYIAQSRSLAMEKNAKRTVRSSSGSQSKLSAVTLRAIQRRQEGLEQNSSRKSDTLEVKPKVEPHEEKKRNKNSWNIRVLKPQQGHSSPPLPDKTRSKKQSTRPTTAPERPLSSRLQKEDTVSHPKTTENAQPNSERNYRKSLGGGSQPAKKTGRQSLGGGNRQQRAFGTAGSVNSGVQPRGQKKFSLPESSQPRPRGYVGGEATQRPRTASEVKRSPRTLAANFAK